MPALQGWVLDEKKPVLFLQLSVKVGHHILSGKKWGFLKITFYKQTLTFFYTRNNFSS